MSEHSRAEEQAQQIEKSRQTVTKESQIEIIEQTFRLLFVAFDKTRFPTASVCDCWSTTSTMHIAPQGCFQDSHAP